MCWAYIAGRFCSSRLGVGINPYLVLFLGALPDIDVLLGGLGIEHRGITHSVLFWAVVFVPIFFKYRKRSIPYFVAVIQHILFGDLVVNRTDPFWPFGFNIGLRVDLLSIENVLLETAGLVIFLILTTRNNGRKIFLGNNRRNVLSILPLLPLVTFVLFIYQQDVQFLLEHETESKALDKLASSATESNLISLVIITHSVLATFLVIPLIQGLRALTKKPIRYNQ
ncbi:MAG: metal-dependent hydrolase [Nitrososphaerales archaeon]